MLRLRVLGAVIEAAKARAARPMREVFQRPQIPIRESYMYRFLVNTVWFARNYLNFVMLCAFVGVLFCPMFLLPLMGALQVHLAKSRLRAEGAKLNIFTPHPYDRHTGKTPKTRGIYPLRQRLILWFWKAFQLCAVILVTWLYGPLAPFLTATIPVFFVAIHALITPYSDDASHFYDSILKRTDMEEEELDKAAPRTPVLGYTGKESDQLQTSSPDVPILHLPEDLPSQFVLPPSIAIPKCEDGPGSSAKQRGAAKDD